MGRSAYGWVYKRLVGSEQFCELGSSWWVSVGTPSQATVYLV